MKKITITLSLVLITMAVVAVVPASAEAKGCRNKQITTLNKGGRVFTACSVGKLNNPVSHKTYLINKLQVRP